MAVNLARSLMEAAMCVHIDSHSLINMFPSRLERSGKGESRRTQEVFKGVENSYYPR
jgi:hypothetical protein